MLVVALELLLGALAIFLGRRRMGFSRVLLTVVGLLLLFLFVLALLT